MAEAKESLKDFAARPENWGRVPGACTLRRIIGDALLHDINAEPEVPVALVLRWLRAEGHDLAGNIIWNHHKHQGACRDV